MNYKNIIQRLTMPIPELEKYHRELRQEEFNNNKPFGFMKLRKALHPILIHGLNIMHFFRGQKITIIGDKRIQTDRPIIFAATHIGWDDIEMIMTVIGEHAYLFWGDPHESYRTMDGFLLNLNGTVIIDTGDKTDRYIGKENSVHLLNLGTNLLIFPEGVWNTSENQLVQYLYSGAAEMAIRSGADIVPVAIMQFNKEFRINIGRNISSDKWRLEQKQSLTDYLREVMASLKWEIYETQEITPRKSIPENASEKYRQSFIDMGKGIIPWQEFVDTTFHPRNIVTPEEAFAYQDKLIPCRENAFLFRKS
jgi:hypothetical protein